MLSVNEAKQKLMSLVEPIQEFEEVSIQRVVGRVLFDPLISNIDSPVFSNSSMDGFAVNSKDLSKASKTHPVELKVVGDIPAGSFGNYQINMGESMRIMTGAPVPGNADVVVPIEQTNIGSRVIDESLPDSIIVENVFESGAYIRVRGEDFNRGEKLLQSGHRVTSRDVGLFAMQGLSRIKVYKKPKVGLISSGDELVDIGMQLSEGKIRETNSYTLSALLSEIGCDVEFLGISADNELDVQKHLDAAVEKDVDLIITSAGVSVGAFDYMRLVIEKFGEINAWRVNMRPGKPLLFGSYKNVPVVGLPGNPVSSFVGFEVFVRPLLNSVSRDLEWRRIEFNARVTEDLYSDGRESYLRTLLVNTASGEMECKFYTHQGSGNLYSLSISNGLIIIPAGVKSVKSGELLKAWLL